MRLGISSYTYNWAVGVAGFPQPRQTLTPADLLHNAADVGVSVVQVADNLPLHKLTTHEIDTLAALAGELEISIEVGTAGVAPAHLREYLHLAEKLRSSVVRVVIDTKDAEPTPDEVVDAFHQVLLEYSRADVWLAIENHDRFHAATLAQIIE